MAENEEDIFKETDTPAVDYSEDDIKTLDWKEHIRRRPGMYIGKLGDGSNYDDGIYVLLKEVLDNSIDEYMMGFGKQITVDVVDGTVTVRDFGRGVPLGKLVDVSSKMNTGGKYDSKAFKKSVGLNGVGIKAVNALARRADEKRPLPLRRPRRGERHSSNRRAERHTRPLHPRQQHLPRLPLQRRLHHPADKELHLPQHRPRDGVQRQALYLPQRPSRPSPRRHDLRAALPAHPSQGRRHRSGHHPCQSAWRGILFIRQRSAHHPGRHTSHGLQGSRVAHDEGIFQTRLRLFRHTQRHDCSRVNQSGGTRFRIADQNQARQPRHGTGRPHCGKIRRRLHQDRTRQLSPPQYRHSRHNPQESTGERA